MSRCNVSKLNTSIINWLKDAGLELPDAPEAGEILEITEVDELQAFIGNKKNRVWLWTVVNH
jgi:insertion element IS1 protein InsB